MEVIGCGFGILLSVYSLYVEHQTSIKADYEALCDISETVSCTDVFSSEQGRIWSHLGLIDKGSILDQPNAVYGVIFYILYYLIYHFGRKASALRSVILVMATGSMVLSAYLSFVLAKVLHIQCIVCFSIYICNFLLFIASACDTSVPKVKKT